MICVYYINIVLLPYYLLKSLRNFVFHDELKIIIILFYFGLLDIASRYPTLWTEQVKSRQNKTNKNSGKKGSKITL